MFGSFGSFGPRSASADQIGAGAVVVGRHWYAVIWYTVIIVVPSKLRTQVSIRMRANLIRAIGLRVIGMCSMSVVSGNSRSSFVSSHSRRSFGSPGASANSSARPARHIDQNVSTLMSARLSLILLHHVQSSAAPLGQVEVDRS